MLLRRLVALGLVPVLAGCSGGRAPGALSSGQPTLPSSGKATVTACPAPPRTTIEWPAGIPANFPKPPGGRLVKATNTATGVHSVQLVTPVSLHESVLFMLDALPRAGYKLGRGDAERYEADAPFRVGDLQGVVRLVATEKNCQTTWLIAVLSSAGSPGTPLLPAGSPSPSPSLPFG